MYFDANFTMICDEETDYNDTTLVQILACCQTASVSEVKIILASNNKYTREKQ